jgi:hypothetical protein
MDIRGVNRIKAFLGMGVDSKRSRITTSNEQRGQQKSNQDQNQAFNMTEEQIAQAFGVLLASLEGSGLSAEKGFDDSGIYFVVKSPDGEVVRTLRDREINELYFKRKMDPQPGNILRRSA